MAENKEIKLNTNPTPVQERYRCQTSAPLLEFLMEKSCRNRTSAKKIIASGRISINNVPTTRATDEVPTDAVVTIHTGIPPQPLNHPKLEVLWEDKDYVILYKKSGLPTVNTAHKSRQETALSIMSQHYKKGEEGAKVFMVNRLDKSTAGFICFAKNIKAKERIVKEWHQRVKHQIFVACVEGELTRETEELTATSAQDEESTTARTITAKIKIDKSSAHGGMHIVQADVLRARIFSLRKLFGDNRLSIFGDVRSRSAFQTDKMIGLEQIVLEIQLPNEAKTRRFERPYPTHYFSWLKEDKGDN